MTRQQSKFKQLRHLAEREVGEHPDSKMYPKGEVQELLHELKVHQVELELQNHELRISQHELARSLEEFEDLFNFAPLAYFIIDRSGVIRKANLTATEQFGIPRSVLQGSALVHLVAPKERDAFHIYYRKLIQSQTPQTIELPLVRRDGSQFYAQIECIPRGVSGGTVTTFRVAIIDISQRKTYEKRLQGLRALDQAILRSQSVIEIVEVALHYLLELTDCARVSIILDNKDHQDNKQHPATAFTQGRKDMKMLVDSLSADNPGRPTLDPGEYRVEFPSHSDAHSDKNNPSTPHLVIPVHQASRQIGIIRLHPAAAAGFDSNMIRVGQETARQLGIAVQQAHLYEQVQRYAQDLEQRVEERTQELHEQQRREHEQRVFAEAMLDIVTGLNSTLDLDQVLERILVNLERVISFDSAHIILFEDNTARVVKWRGEAPPENTDEYPLDLPTSDFPIYRLHTGESTFIDDTGHISDWQQSDYGARSSVSVLIRSDEVIYGVLNIIKFQERFFSRQQIEHLEAFAAHASIAVNNARLHQKEQHLAAMEERQRLARDLHDAVSQSLFSLSIMAESLLKTTSPRNRKLSKYLRDMVTLAKSAQAEMRLLLLEMRPTSMKEAALSDLIEKLVLGFKSRSKQNIQLTIDEKLPELSGEVKTTLFRITQEALNNSIKYAESDKLEVNIGLQDDYLVLCIQDNGKGFNVQAAMGDGHGLSIMRERAEAIGAKFSIISKEGHGTQVNMMLPQEQAI